MCLTSSHKWDRLHKIDLKSAVFNAKKKTFCVLFKQKRPVFTVFWWKTGAKNAFFVLKTVCFDAFWAILNTGIIDNQSVVFWLFSAVSKCLISQNETVSLIFQGLQAHQWHVFPVRFQQLLYGNRSQSSAIAPGFRPFRAMKRTAWLVPAKHRHDNRKCRYA